MNTQAVFVSGTDTHIGKTIVCSWLCTHWQADYWKPIQSGLDGETDSQTCQRLSPTTRIHSECYRLRNPLSPHAAAQLDNQHIDLAQFRLPHANKLIIEGAGGLLVPLNHKKFIIDLINQFATPTILVASSELGTINHTLLSLEALHHRHIPCLGVILVGKPNESNAQAIEQFGNIAVLDQLPWFEPLHSNCLKQRPLSKPLLQALTHNKTAQDECP